MFTCMTVHHTEGTRPGPARFERVHRRSGHVILATFCIFLVLAGFLQVTSHKADAAAVLKYKVKPGDTLTGLAARYGTTVRELRELNRVSAKGLIRIGETLRIPAPVDLPISADLPARLAANAERLALRRHTQKWAKKNGIPADLLEATLWLESGFNQSKVSKTGAVGVGQLMPDTSAFIARSLIGRDLDPNNAEDNIRMSARYLWYLLKMHDGNATKALQAYYQGQGSIRSNGLYPDTVQYARNVQALRKRFR